MLEKVKRTIRSFCFSCSFKKTSNGSQTLSSLFKQRGAKELIPNPVLVTDSRDTIPLRRKSPPSSLAVLGGEAGGEGKILAEPFLPLSGMFCIV